MPVRFTCPHCGRETMVADEYVGQSGPCAGCGETITIPGELRAAEAQPSAAAVEPARGSAAWIFVVVGVAALGVLLVCGGLLAALLLPAIQNARMSARRLTCSNNLKQILLALHNYHDVWGSLPPAYTLDEKGNRMHSWRALILPYLDANLAAQYRYDEPWNGPNNSRLAKSCPAVFLCPEDTSAGPGETSYFVIVGPNTMFPGAQSISFRQVTDGTANTLAVVETSGQRINWLEPRDLDMASLPLNSVDGGVLGGIHSQGVNVALGDGSVHFLPVDVSSDQLRGMSTRDGGEPVLVP